MATKKQQLAQRRKRRNEQRKELNKARRQKTANGEAERPTTVRYKPMIERYHARSQISDQQFESAQEFRCDWLEMGSLLTSRIGVGSFEWIPPGVNEISPRQLDAKRRVDKAIIAMGKHLSSVAINVCLFDYAASEWALAFGNRPADDGISCLRLALDALTDHYKETRRSDARNRDMLELQCAD